jgi:ribosome-associated heat shock protein Hsp15
MKSSLGFPLAKVYSKRLVHVGDPLLLRWTIQHAPWTLFRQRSISDDRFAVDENVLVQRQLQYHEHSRENDNCPCCRMRKCKSCPFPARAEEKATEDAEKTSKPRKVDTLRVRMDKWLWAARFFKTRSLAARACELGRVESNGQPSKAAREVRAGDLLRVRNDSGTFQVEALALSEIRGPAAVAQTLYRETEASRESRLKLAEERRTMARFEGSQEGKPSKRARRQIERLRRRT